MVCGLSQTFTQPGADANDSRPGLGEHSDRKLKEVLHARPDFECRHRARHPGAPRELHRIIEEDLIASSLHEQRRQARKIRLKRSDEWIVRVMASEILRGHAT